MSATPPRRRPPVRPVPAVRRGGMEARGGCAWLLILFLFVLPALAAGCAAGILIGRLA